MLKELKYIKFKKALIKKVAFKLLFNLKEFAYFLFLTFKLKFISLLVIFINDFKTS